MLYLCRRIISLLSGNSNKLIELIMKKSVMSVIILIMGIFVISSCSEKPATKGTLTVQVMDSTGAFVPDVKVNLSASRENLFTQTNSTGIFTNANGAVIFHDLTAGTYWCGAVGWEDYSAVKIYAGIDQYVILWLNKPLNHKK